MSDKIEALVAVQWSDAIQKLIAPPPPPIASGPLHASASMLALPESASHGLNHSLSHGLGHRGDGAPRTLSLAESAKESGMRGSFQIPRAPTDRPPPPQSALPPHGRQGPPGPFEAAAAQSTAPNLILSNIV